MIAIRTPAIGQAAEPTGAQAEVPAVELAGDDGADTERPQGPHAGVASESALLEVLLADLPVGDGADLALFLTLLTHVVTPPSSAERGH